MQALRLMAVLAHPDDESLGVGGTLAKYVSEGVEVFLVTATRGDSGRYRGLRSDDPQHPGRLALANIRERELRAAASTLGVREVSILNYQDQQLDQAHHCRPFAGTTDARRWVELREHETGFKKRLSFRPVCSSRCYQCSSFGSY